MPAQVVSSYTFWADYGPEPDDGRAMYSCALTDWEAIGFAAETVRAGEASRVHVRRAGEYLAEVWAGYQGSIQVELHREGSEVVQFELPCFAVLAGFWIQRVRMK